MTLSAEAQAWIEQHCRGRIVHIEQQGRWRPHHFVTLDRDGSTVEILARSRRDREMVAGSRFLSHFDIAHEARVYRAFQGSGLKIVAFSWVSTRTSDRCAAGARRS